jgi:hypothetical protein
MFSCAFFQTCFSHKGLVGNWLPIKLPIFPTRREELLPGKAASSGGEPHKGGGDFSTRENEELSLSLESEKLELKP